MLTQHYNYYIGQLLIAALTSVQGIIALLFLAGGIWALFALRTKRPGLRLPVFWLCLVASVGLITNGFYSSIYEFDEDPQSLIDTGKLTDDADCGPAWTNWAKGGYGMGNPCPAGCYRALTLRKQMQMSGFPPFPNYRREVQCLRAE
jgi:hypothetical protein